MTSENGIKVFRKSVRCVNGNVIAGKVGGNKEWESLDVVPVRVRDKEVNLAMLLAIADEGCAQVSDSGTGVEDDHLIADVDLEAGGIATVPDVLWSRYRYGSTGAPECDTPSRSIQLGVKSLLFLGTI